MDVRSKAPAVLGTLTVALFCVVSVYNQSRITDTMIALSPVAGSMAGRMRLASGWVAVMIILWHLGLCFILVMLMIGLARLKGIVLQTQNVVVAIGLAHVPLLLWAAYGAVLFAGSFDKEQVEVFAGSIARLMLTRPFAYLGGIIWLVALSVWQFGVGTRQAATLTLPPVLTIWAVLSVLGWVTNVIPQ